MIEKVHNVKAVAFGLVVTAAVVLSTGLAGAQTTTYDPGAEITTQFDGAFPQLLDMARSLAPLAVGGGLVLLAIRWVVGAFSRGRVAKPTAG